MSWVSRISRAVLSTLPTYTPGKSVETAAKEVGLTNIVKLASNENPLGSPLTEREWETLRPLLSVYPDIANAPVIDTLAKGFGVGRDQIVMGCGSDEVLQLIALAFFSPGDDVLTSESTFSEYRFVTQLMGATMIMTPMRDFRFDVDALISALTPATKAIFIANPNNPTGTIITQTELDRLVAATPEHVLIVMDEAYAEFATSVDFPDSLAKMKTHPNIIVLRTFSKLYGLAALRVGVGIADSEVVAALNRVRLPFNTNAVALHAANLALNAHSFVAASLSLVREGKVQLSEALTGLGLKVLPTEANFLCFFVDGSADAVCDALLLKGFILRSLRSFGLDNAVRVTIGTAAQNDSLIAALSDTLRR